MKEMEETKDMESTMTDTKLAVCGVVARKQKLLQIPVCRSPHPQSLSLRNHDIDIVLVSPILP